MPGSTANAPGEKTTLGSVALFYDADSCRSPVDLIPIARSSEYAIRALTYLASWEGDGYCLARRMAEDLGIPAPFLGKCLQPLVVRGLLASQRGRCGSG